MKLTKLHLTDQCNRSASIIDEKFQRADDYIHQYLIQHMANAIKVRPFLSSMLQYNLGLQFFGKPLQL